MSCMKKDYYLILRLTPKATADEIRSAYRRRALEVHPDISGAGSSPFLELQEAYAVLSDPARRAAYDREAGEIPIRYRPAARGAGGVILQRHRGEPLAATRDEATSRSRSFESHRPSFEERLEHLWSDCAFPTQPQMERMENLTVDVPLSPRQAIEGGAVRILVPVRMVCRACGGGEGGNAGFHECRHCEGQGAVRGEYPVTVRYPAGLQGDYFVRIPLDRVGIPGRHLNVRLRPVEAIW